ncbi:MAG: pyridoxamine 5'-phosphate oxidase [Gemmatimonadota bacterium]
MSLISTLRAMLTIRKGVFTGLDESSVGQEPFGLFDRWYGEARRAGLYLPESMTLATSTPEGVPSARLVLLKRHDDRGFVFFTNYESRKASELEANPNAALAIHWPILQRQVRIEGAVERITEEESFSYYRTRPRGSRIGAWASPQSRVIPDRALLEARVAEFEARFRGEEVPLPPYWGGYRVRPDRIEFWQGRANRLHDRFLFSRSGEAWSVERLAP